MEYSLIQQGRELTAFARGKKYSLPLQPGAYALLNDLGGVARIHGSQHCLGVIGCLQEAGDQAKTEVLDLRRSNFETDIRGVRQTARLPPRLLLTCSSEVEQFLPALVVYGIQIAEVPDAE